MLWALFTYATWVAVILGVAYLFFDRYDSSCAIDLALPSVRPLTARSVARRLVLGLANALLRGKGVTVSARSLTSTLCQHLVIELAKVRTQWREIGPAVPRTLRALFVSRRRQSSHYLYASADTAG